jgi:glutathione S-transferase
MLKLLQFFPTWNIPNPSPFCMRVETYLRMAEIPYENKYTANPNASPTGKFPAIIDDGKTIPDSSSIIDYLKEKHGDTLDQHLTAADKGKALCMQRMIEEHLYWMIVYSRWISVEGWETLQTAFFGKLPLLLKIWLPGVLRKKVRRQLDGQGLGRMNEKEMFERGKKDVQALVDILGEQDFFFGDKPTSFDACAYATIDNILHTPIDSPVKQFAQQFKSLEDYCARMKAKYYPD